MHRQALGDDLRHRQPRRQAAERVLEDDLHVGAQLPQALGLSSSARSTPGEPDAALRLHQAQQRIAHGGFAGAALADQPDGLALMHHDIDAVDGADMADRPAQHAAADREMHAHIGTLDQRGGVVVASGSGWPRGSAASSIRV